MKNNLTKIFSKIIAKILTIIIIIASLIIPSIVIASPSGVDVGVDISLLNESIQSYYEQYNPDKYLFVGNSKTYYNNFPFMFQNYMKAIGTPVIVREAARGGHTLSQLWKNEEVRNEFNNKFDYVVLQPKLLSEKSEEDAAVNMVNELKKHNPNIKVIINGIWKSGDEYKINIKAQTLMNERFRRLKEEITNKCGVETKISYWGQAVLRAYYTCSISRSSLFVDDRHPSILSTYLGVACLYSTINDKKPGIDYNGTVVNSQFSSTKNNPKNNWYYQIDKDRWNKDITNGVDNPRQLQDIAYDTYKAQQGSSADKVDRVLSIDNSPRINIKNRDKNKGVNIIITDFSGVKQEDITLYKSDKKTIINSKYYSVKPETREGVTYRLTYSLNNDFFNKKDKKIYIVAKDKNGNYNKSTFNIKWKKNNKYSVDAAPRLKRFELINNKKDISFKVVDKKGISYLKVYDLNQKDDKGKSVLIKQVKESKDTKQGKTVNIDVNHLMENKDKSDEKSHYYTIKVVSKDLNGRKCKRIVNFRISDK